MSTSGPDSKDSPALVSTWTIAILASVALWLGWRMGDRQVVLAALAGFVAFIAFRFSPTAHVRSK